MELPKHSVMEMALEMLRQLGLGSDLGLESESELGSDLGLESESELGLESGLEPEQGQALEALGLRLSLSQ